MSKLFTDFLTEYGNWDDKYKRAFKKKELEYELRHEDETGANRSRAAGKPGPGKNQADSNHQVDVFINGKKWKTMGKKQAMAASRTLIAKGKHVNIKAVNESFDIIQDAIDNEELTEELLQMVEEFEEIVAESDDEDPEESEDDESEDEDDELEESEDDELEESVAESDEEDVRASRIAEALK